jgi:hypothetical protein
MSKNQNEGSPCSGFLLGWLVLSWAGLPGPARGDVLTYHNDNARTGQNLNETILSPANVNWAQFGLLRVVGTQGRVDAQPLYATGISIPGLGARNVLFVATEHDLVYAFDADNGNTLWSVSLLGSGETPSDDRGCSQVSPEIGVTATPVIDRNLGTNGTIFLVAMSKNTNTLRYIQRLHALDLATGADELPPVTISATYPGTGDNSSGGNVVFDPAQYKERAGLLLLNGIVYTAWASHCDYRPYTGWIIGYDETTLAQTSVLNITPNGNEGAIWMSGAGLAADSDSYIYFLAGNGTFDTTLDANGFPLNGDFGNAFMKLSTAGNVLTPADYFATYATPTQNSQDTDLGSGGALVLDITDNTNGIHQLAVGAGKDQNLYVVNRSNMGKFNPANDNAIYEKLSGVLPGGVWAMPACFNGTIYYGPVGKPIMAFAFQNAILASSSSQTPGSFAYPGATPSISANGALNGIVWVAENVSPAVLHAYAANNLATELYNSNQAGNGRDHFGSGNKFITPTIANGQVYVGTTSGVGVFGLLNLPPPAVALTSPLNGASYTAPATVNLAASVTTNGHSITQVKFYNNGSNLLGADSTPPYNFTWSNVGAGSYALTAQLVYDIGSTLNSAAVNITVNPPPTVTLTSPLNGASYTAPATINLAASVTPNNHTITQVQFYSGRTLLGTVSSAPYSLTWTNVSAGNYTLTGRLTYDAGSTLNSAPVSVTVARQPKPKH